MKPDLLLRIADEDDVADIVTLLNTCYRGSDGWTTEAGILTGERITPEAVQDMLAGKRHYFFVLENNGQVDTDINDALLGCIVVQLDMAAHQQTAFVEMTAVHPSVQKQGVGGEMLQSVETFAGQHLRQGWMKLSVVEPRAELIAYYERRGYERTHNVYALPEADYGQPIAEGLKMVELQKRLLG